MHLKSFLRLLGLKHQLCKKKGVSNFARICLAKNAPRYRIVTCIRGAYCFLGPDRYMLAKSFPALPVAY